MKKKTLLLLVWFLMVGTAHAETYYWEYDTTNGKLVPATADVQRSQSATGPFSTIATIPSLPATYAGTGVPAGWSTLYTRIANVNGVSNVVSYTTPAPTTGTVGPMGPAGPQGIQGIPGTPADMTRVQALELRVTQLEQAATVPVAPPPVTGPLTSRLIDPTHMEITCVGSSMKTTGSGLKRVVECLP